MGLYRTLTKRKTNMFDYEPIRRMILAEQNREHVSDKDCGKRLGVSERQIRKARIQGMDWTQADLFACRIGRHPVEIWGEEWLSPEALFAADIHEGVCTAEEAVRLTAAGAWRG